MKQFIPLIRRAFQNHSLWFDTEISGGSEWWRKISNQIANSNLFIYVISNKSLATSYCQAQLREAERLHIPILPVLMDRLKSPYPGETEADIADILKDLEYVDLSGSLRDPERNLELVNAIKQHLAESPKRSANLRESNPTPLPAVADKQDSDSLVKATYIGGLILVIGVVMVGILGLMPNVFSNNPNPDSPPGIDVETATERELRVARSSIPQIVYMLAEYHYNSRIDAWDNYNIIGKGLFLGLAIVAIFYAFIFGYGVIRTFRNLINRDNADGRITTGVVIVLFLLPIDALILFLAVTEVMGMLLTV